MINPINPKEINTSCRGVLYDKVVRLINEAITTRDWHDVLPDGSDFEKNYHAIIIHPYGVYNLKLMEIVIKDFSELGWVCMYKPDCYDARGPHSCFYVHKKHFNED